MASVFERDRRQSRGHGPAVFPALQEKSLSLRSNRRRSSEDETSSIVMNDRQAGKVGRGRTARDLDEGPVEDWGGGDALVIQMIGRTETLDFLPGRREGNTGGGRWNSWRKRTLPFGVLRWGKGSRAVGSFV